MTLPPVIVDLHGLSLAFQSADPALVNRFEEVYGHLPRPAGGTVEVLIDWRPVPSPAAPLPPANMPAISAGDLVSYYGREPQIAIRMPKYALITLDLERRQITGEVTAGCLETYGAFEDVLMISLAPLYRRRGWFALHAFAALAPGGRAALISGAMGAGKTTTGLALLSAGWRLLSNDSPLLTLADGQVRVLAYPGRLSAFDDSLARFEGLKRFIPPPGTGHLGNAAERSKRVFRAEEAFNTPWASAGPAGGIFLPQVVPGLAQSELVPIAPTEAVLALLPQAVEGWDRAAIGETLHLLGRLAGQVPGYRLKLAPDVEKLPGLIGGALR